MTAGSILFYSGTWQENEMKTSSGENDKRFTGYVHGYFTGKFREVGYDGP